MTNMEICMAFAKGEKNGVHNGSMSISCNGEKLLSYSTPIAKRFCKKVIFNGSKYSVTTSKQQTYAKRAFQSVGIELVFTTKYVPCGYQDLERYL